MLLLIKPFPTFLITTILPIITLFINKCRNSSQEQIEMIGPINLENTNNIDKINNNNLKLNEKYVKYFICSEKEKPSIEDTISAKYINKIILFGYIVVIIS